MAKKKNSRKALAVALGIMGIAGLSVASASSLNLTAGDEVGIGVDTFANCQGDTAEITVNYSYAADAATVSGYGITEVALTGIAGACDAHDLTLSLEDAAGAELFATSATTISGTTFTYDATSEHIDVATDLGDVTVIIQ